MIFKKNYVTFDCVINSPERISKMFNKNLIEHIEVHPNIQHGKPCIKGTRTPVYVILEALALGMNFEDVLKEFSPITLEDIRACISYAVLLTDEQELIPS